MGSVFELARIDEGKLTLNNKATDAIWLVTYRKAKLYDKVSTASGRYVTESDWSGSAEKLFEQLIPCLEIIRSLLNPIEESFMSSPTSSEYTHGNSTYYDEFQASMYTCRFRKDDGSEATAICSFKNWDLIGVASEDMGFDERNALKQNILLRIESPEAIQAGVQNSNQVLPDAANDSTQPEKPLTEEPAPLPTPTPELGWCWGAFFLTWLWMVGNKTWIGLWTLVPFLLLALVMFFAEKFHLIMYAPPLYLLVAGVFGRYGRRWAWCSGRTWQSVDHFSKVQKRWSVAGVIIVMSVNIFCLVSAYLAIDSFNQGEFRVARNGQARATLLNIKTNLEAYYADNQKYPLSIDKLDYKVPQDVILDCSMSKQGYECTTAHKDGTRQFFTSYSSGAMTWQDYKAGNQVHAPRLVTR